MTARLRRGLESVEAAADEVAVGAESTNALARLTSMGVLSSRPLPFADKVGSDFGQCGVL